MKQEVQYLLEIIKYILNRKQGELMVPAKDMDWERERAFLKRLKRAVSTFLQ